MIGTSMAAGSLTPLSRCTSGNVSDVVSNPSRAARLTAAALSSMVGDGRDDDPRRHDDPRWRRRCCRARTREGQRGRSDLRARPPASGPKGRCAPVQQVAPQRQLRLRARISSLGCAPRAHSITEDGAIFSVCDEWEKSGRRTRRPPGSASRHRVGQRRLLGALNDAGASAAILHQPPAHQSRIAARRL